MSATGFRAEEFEFPSELGNERAVMDRVAEVVGPLQLPTSALENLKTAVSEAAMNAIEHGNGGRAEIPVHVRVSATGTALCVQITDQGGATVPEPEAPDLKAKLAGTQAPRGWGLFLIKSLVDEVHEQTDGMHHTVELMLDLHRGNE
jgi:anti-sigma regulatory factor (Ser/Thr protein kinase)